MHALIAVVLAATLYQVEPVNGTVSFSVVKWGALKEEGLFRQFTAQIHYDPRDPSRSRVAFDVATASIDTNNRTRDETLRSADFLHVAKYPKMTFRSVRVIPRGKNSADVTGDLTIRGVTRRITVPVRLTGVGKTNRGRPIAGFETAFTLDRRHFGVLGSRWSGGVPGILGNIVSIRIVAGGIER